MPAHEIPGSRWLIAAGALLLAAGLLVHLAPRVRWLGRLPGDFILRRGNFTFYFPLTTCLLLSLALSLLVILLRRGWPR
jgi:hypothetical protein